MDQHFLASPEKIAVMLAALAPEPGDRVMELGAGRGTVAAHLPSCRELTLVDLDPVLCTILRGKFAARGGTFVRCADALAVLRTHPTDRILSNLPWFLTREVLETLRGVSFTSAVVTVRAGEDLSAFADDFVLTPVAELEEADFCPPQPFRSQVWRLTRRTPAP